MARKIETKEAYYACALSILGVYNGRGKARYYPSVEEATSYFINKEAHWVTEPKASAEAPKMVQQTLF